MLSYGHVYDISMLPKGKVGLLVNTGDYYWFGVLLGSPSHCHLLLEFLSTFEFYTCIIINQYDCNYYNYFTLIIRLSGLFFSSSTGSF